MVDPPTISRLYVPQGIRVTSGEMPTNSESRLFGGEFSLEQLYRAVAAVQKKLTGIYSSTLDKIYFLGGWAEEPYYKTEDYKSYADWLRHSSENPDEAESRKFALIGANRLWGTLDDSLREIHHELAALLYGSYYSPEANRLHKMQFIETCGIFCPDGLFVRTRPIKDTFYDDKRVYFANPPKNHGMGLDQ